MTACIYIFWTCKDKQEAETISRSLLEQHLIACATLLPPVESLYRWKGKIEHSHEIKVILKTRKQHFDALYRYIYAHCSYEVPEIVAIDIAQGNPHYLSWIAQETSL